MVCRHWRQRHHAAIKYANVAGYPEFFPFGVSKIVGFPNDYRLVICNSGIGNKSAEQEMSSTRVVLQAA